MASKRSEILRSIRKGGQTAAWRGRTAVPKRVVQRSRQGGQALLQGKYPGEPSASGASLLSAVRRQFEHLGMRTSAVEVVQHLLEFGVTASDWVNDLVRLLMKLGDGARGRSDPGTAGDNGAEGPTGRDRRGSSGGHPERAREVSPELARDASLIRASLERLQDNDEAGSLYCSADLPGARRSASGNSSFGDWPPTIGTSRGNPGQLGPPRLPTERLRDRPAVGPALPRPRRPVLTSSIVERIGEAARSNRCSPGSSRPTAWPLLTSGKSCFVARPVAPQASPAALIPSLPSDSRDPGRSSDEGSRGLDPTTPKICSSPSPRRPSRCRSTRTGIGSSRSPGIDRRTIRTGRESFGRPILKT